ncbi:class I SAM-dependent methyltransferase [Arthrobacter sp.]|uniref:class I SAM-dependent methyltransferase n=1 Tax=Arthrobacter sp. TaxID=1667 RepID=UPI003A925A3E
MDRTPGTEAADFYGGLVADAYALLKSETFDAERYVAFVDTFGEPGLEIGCGDGHPLLTLVAATLDVEGVDSSPDMLARAADAADAAGLEVELHQARMEDLDLRRSYRTIYLAGPTFELLPDDEHALAALHAMRRHLRPDGTVMIPLWTPTPTDPAVLGVAREAFDGAGALLRYTPLAEHYDVATRTRTTRVLYERIHPNGRGERVERDWIIHWQTPRTLAGLAQDAGLAILMVHPEEDLLEGTPGEESTVYLQHAPSTP